MLTVTMDLADANFSTTSLCARANFCTGNASSCSCALKPTDPTYTPSIFAQCQAACSTWAVKDLDCPDAGCFGFGVDLSQTTFNQNTAHLTPAEAVVLPGRFQVECRFRAAQRQQWRMPYTTLPGSDFCLRPGTRKRSALSFGIKP